MSHCKTANRRQFSRKVGGVLVGLSVLGLGMPLASAADADNWPTKPIKIVVPFPPGGSTDNVGRLLSAELGKVLNQTVLVENRGGANGNIGSDMVAKADPDGYTLLVSGVGSNAISYAIYPQMNYKDSDFKHVSLLATGPNVLVVNPEFAAKDLKTFVDMAKADPGKYAYASSGSGTSGHLAMEMLKQAAKIDLVHIPYKGGSAAITDTIGGRVSALFLNQDNLLPQVNAGKLRALAVASEKRNPAYPDVPTVAESGYPGFAAESWFGIAAPAGTPDAVVDKLNKGIVQAMKSPDFRQKLEQVGFVVVGNSPKEASAFVASEIDKWGKTAKASGARVD